jgi:hypothetical protein
MIRILEQPGRMAVHRIWGWARRGSPMIGCRDAPVRFGDRVSSRKLSRRRPFLFFDPDLDRVVNRIARKPRRQDHPPESGRFI